MTDAQRTTKDKQKHRLRIGDLCVDLGTRSLSRDGELIELPKLSYDLLLALAEAAPNFLTHDGLVERVWAGRIVSPETVTQRVRLLRRALGDDAHEPRYVGLVRGVGYRLLAEVEEWPEATPGPAPEAAPSETLPPPSGLRFRVALGIASALVLLVAAGLLRLGDRPEPLPINAVAVLPFANATATPANDYLSEGLADELRAQLGRVEGLQVSARASSRAFLDGDADAPTIAQQLGVRWLIDGTLRQGDGLVGVSLHLIDGASGFRVSSQSFERRMPELQAIQADIATQMVADLAAAAGIELVPSTPTNISVSAAELMMLARGLEREVRANTSVDVAKLERVIDLYGQAIDRDPESATAHGSLAGALLYFGDVDAAEAHLEEALRINPDSSEVQYILGLYRWRSMSADPTEAFQQAVDLNPNNVDAVWELAKSLWYKSQVSAAGALFRQGLELDPMTLSRYADIGNYYGMMGMPERALEIAAEIQRRFPTPDSYPVLARIYEVAGDLDEAIAWASRANIDGNGGPEAAWQLAELYARLGDETSALGYEPEPSIGRLFFARRYDELIDFAEERMIDLPNDMKLVYALAFARNAVGRHAEAADLLERSGVPEDAAGFVPRTDAEQALVTLADALSHSGETDRGRQYAERMASHMQGVLENGGENSWWPHLYGACALSLLDRDTEALALVARLADIRGLSWYPVLKDAPCFRRLEGRETYDAVVAGEEARRNVLRARVTDTLQRHGLLEAVAAR